MILPPAAYAHVFEEWRGTRVAEFWAPGNVGDLLIRKGAETLYRAFQIEITSKVEEASAIFWGGGGNMGDLYPTNRERRRNLLATAMQLRIPFIILPQSWTSPERLPGARLFARELMSKEIAEGAILAPDLALAWTPEMELPDPIEEEGFFFRKDKEASGQVPALKSRGDPITMANSAEQYIRLAAQFARVHTDRLHFAIAAILAGRVAHLYPNSYFKNKGVFDMWLRGPNCFWQEANLDNTNTPRQT